MEKNEGFWQFHQQALGRWMISNHEKARKNRQTGELGHVILENWWLKHQQLLFHETYRLGDPNHAQPIIRGFWGNWYQVINHTYSSCCWWNPGWNSNVSWLNQSSNMIHFDIPCFLVFPWTFYPWISWWTLHIFPKKTKTITFVDKMWMKSPILKVWNAMKCHEMPPNLPNSQAPLPRHRQVSSQLPMSPGIDLCVRRRVALLLAPNGCVLCAGQLRAEDLRRFTGLCPWDPMGFWRENHGKTMEKPGKNHWFFYISGFPAFVSIQFEENMWNQGTWGFHLTCS